MSLSVRAVSSSSDGLWLGRAGYCRPPALFYAEDAIRIRGIGGGGGGNSNGHRTGPFCSLLLLGFMQIASITYSIAVHGAGWGPGGGGGGGRCRVEFVCSGFSGFFGGARKVAMGRQRDGALVVVCSTLF